MVVEDYAPEASFLSVTAKVDGPRDSSMEIELEQVGPRRYEGRFPLAGEGRYQITGVGRSNDRTDRVFGGLMVAYSQEFLRLRANPVVLKQITDQTGGRTLTGQETGEDIFVEQRQATSTSLPVFDWFLLTLACLVPLDVAVRRVQIDMQLIRDWLQLSRTRQPSDEVFSKLLRRKRTMDDTLHPHDDQLVAARQQQKEVPEADEPTTPAQNPEAEAAPPPPEVSTTERLLATRRRIRDQEKETE